MLIEDVGGFEPIQAGDRGWLMLNLTPGTYVALCFVPDPETGKAHADLGMIQSFDVSKPVPAAAKQPATSEEIIGQTRDDWIVAENATYIPAIDQLGYHLDLAHQHFIDQAFKDAAREIRAGATFLKEAAAKLEEKTTKTTLDAAAGDLMTLANRVEQGQLTSVTELNAAFEKAYQVDVKNRWIGLKAEEIAPVADRVSTHFEQAIQALKDKDYPPETRQVGKILEDIGQQLKTLGAEVETTTHAAPDK